jgi:hypothetical protein
MVDKCFDESIWGIGIIMKMEVVEVVEKKSKKGEKMQK